MRTKVYIQLSTIVLDFDPPDVQFNHQGYLFLAGPDGAQTLKENHDLQWFVASFLIALIHSVNSVMKNIACTLMYKH